MGIISKATVKIKLTRLEKYRTQVKADLNNQANGPVRKAMKQWGVRYRSFAQERFDAFSKGGGDWPPLAPSTIARRRAAQSSRKKPKPSKELGAVESFVKFVGGTSKSSSGSNEKPAPKKRKSKKPAKKGDRKVSILRDLGVLFAVLAPTFASKPGSLEVQRPFGITVGYGGPSKHGSGSVTIADIASFHQVGAGHLPQRKIIVAPPVNVTALMAQDMQRALRTL